MRSLIVFFSFAFLLYSSANAQSWLNKLGKSAENAAKRAVENRVEQKADEAANKTMDKMEDSAKKSKEKSDSKKRKKEGEDSEKQEQRTVSQAESNKLSSYSKFDFVPGEKVIFFDDFSNTEVGDFPAEWNTNGSGEVVTNNAYEGKWLKFVDSENALWTDALLKLPDNYTIEFDVIPIKGDEGSMGGYVFRLIKSINAKSYDAGSIPGKGGFMFNIEYFGRPNYRAYLNDYQGSLYDLEGVIDNEKLYQKENQKYHIAVWVQKSRLRLYQDENKLFDVQKAFPDAAVKIDRIRFEEGAALISNIRIATGQPDMRNKLITEGKLVSYGIYFDVNKDIVKPESYGTLKEIAAILNEVPDTKVKIVGHTDSDGQDAANLDLSKRRAASVKAELVKSFGVNSDRLSTDGAGESQSVAPNNSPANKALNRRVEFIKL